MLTVKGIYKSGKIVLKEDVDLPNQVDVLVTFLSDEIEPSRHQGGSKYSFKKTQLLLKDLKSSLADEVISERRDEK